MPRSHAALLNCMTFALIPCLSGCSSMLAWSGPPSYVEHVPDDHITLGSTREDVLRIQGNPTRINRYPSLGHETWSYGTSSLEISTRTGEVLEWSDYRGRLKVLLRPGPNVTSASLITRGSHMDDVIRIQATPTRISRYASLGHETWSYGTSSIEISTRTRRVLEWRDYNGTLKVGMTPGKHVTDTPIITQGSHKDDVLRLHGTPSTISRYPALGYEVWSYGTSSVKVSLRTKRVVEYVDRGSLKIAKTGEKTPDRQIKFHRKTGDLTLYYDNDQTYPYRCIKSTFMSMAEEP